MNEKMLRYWSGAIRNQQSLISVDAIIDTPHPWVSVQSLDHSSIRVLRRGQAEAENRFKALTSYHQIEIIFMGWT